MENIDYVQNAQGKPAQNFLPVVRIGNMSSTYSSEEGYTQIKSLISNQNRIYPLQTINPSKLWSNGITFININVEVAHIYRNGQVQRGICNNQIHKEDIEAQNIQHQKEQGKKRKSQSIGKENRTILLSWLYEHSNYPYPTSRELIELQNITNLSLKQLRTFFVNYRMRFLKRNPKNGLVNQSMKISTQDVV